MSDQPSAWAMEKAREIAEAASVRSDKSRTELEAAALDAAVAERDEYHAWNRVVEIERAFREGEEAMKQKCVAVHVPIPAHEIERGHVDDRWAEGFRSGRGTYREAVRSMPLEPPR